MPSKRATRAVKKVQRVMRQVSPEEAKAVIEEVAEVTEERVQSHAGDPLPGETRNGEKVPYTYRYIVENPNKFGPIVDFIPERTVTLTFGGVPVQAYAGIEMHVPKVFKDIYDRSNREMRQANANHLKEAGYDSIVAIGAGALEPE